MARHIPLNGIAIPAAGTYTSDSFETSDYAYLLAQFKLASPTGGTTIKAYLQTSVDGEATWIDIICFAFGNSAETKISKVQATNALTANTTPSDGALTDDTVLDGVIGDQCRVKYVVAGTFSAGTITLAVGGK